MTHSSLDAARHRLREQRCLGHAKHLHDLLAREARAESVTAALRALSVAQRLSKACQYIVRIQQLLQISQNSSPPLSVLCALRHGHHSLDPCQRPELNPPMTDCPEDLSHPIRSG